MMQNKLPKDWEIKNLGEVCDEIFAGGDVPKNNFSKVKTEQYQIPIFANGEKNLGFYGYTNIIKVNYPALTISGRGTIGFSVVRLKPFFPIVRLLVLKPNINTDVKYLKYSIDNSNIKHTGSSIPQLTVPTVKNIKIPIPSLQTQQAIVSKIEELFSELDKGIEDLKTAQQQLKTYRQSVLKWAFEGKLTNENVKDGKLPKGWEIVKLDRVADVSSSKRIFQHEYVSYGVPFYRTKEVKELSEGKELSIELFISIEKYEEIKSKFKIPQIGDILLSAVGTIGISYVIKDEKPFYFKDGNLMWFRDLKGVNSYYLHYGLTNFIRNGQGANTSGSAYNALTISTMKEFDFPLPPLEEQNQIVQEIESRLSVADKMEESIAQSLLQAEALRKSILKKAFSGELIKEVIQEKIHKPKNDYFFQMQLIGKIAAISKRNKIEHGEMTIAKYAYLSDKLFDIPTGFEFNRWHLGPYPPAIKKVVNNKQYFQRTGNYIEVINEQTLFKSTNDFSTSIDDAISNLVSLFSKYKTPTERSHKTELLATICKVIEDIKTTDLKLVRASMKEWKIILKTSLFKNKAEKFNEEETKNCIEFIVKKGWDRKLIK